MRGSMLGVMIATACALVGEARPAAACTPWPAGVQRRDVLPDDGAVDVPTNARVVVTYETTDGSTGEIALRVQGGAEVAVPAERVSNDGWHVSLELAPALEPSTTYEVLDRLDLGCAYGSEAECLGDPVVIATFTTGTGPDTTPPALVDVSIVESFDCSVGTSCSYAPNLAIHAVQVGDVVDDGPAEWVRIEYLDDDGDPIAGPTWLTTAASGCGGGGTDSWRMVVSVPRRFQVRAVDLAGNVEETAHAIEGSACEALWGGTACELEPPGDGDGGDGGGCHVGAPGSGGLAIVLVIALGVAVRRRRRALAALLVVAPTWGVLDARPAEACVPWPRGVSGREVIPEDGAIGVPTNARVVVTYATNDGSVGDVSLRAQGGETVPATVEIIAGGGFYTSLELTAPLAPSTTYEVLDRLDLECAFDSSMDCLVDPSVIATFTTGTSTDTTPPRLVDVQATSRYQCGGPNGTGCTLPALGLHAFEVGAVEDDRPSSWVQYEYLDATGARVARLGALLPAAHRCGASGDHFYAVVFVPEIFQLRAVDLAGNEEVVAHGPLGASCEALQDSSTCDPAPDAGAERPDAGDAAAVDAGGCRATAAPGGLAVGLLALAALGGGLRRAG